MNLLCDEDLYQDCSCLQFEYPWAHVLGSGLPQKWQKVMPFLNIKIETDTVFLIRDSKYVGYSHSSTHELTSSCILTQ